MKTDSDLKTFEHFIISTNIKNHKENFWTHTVFLDPLKTHGGVEKKCHNLLSWISISSP